MANNTMTRSSRLALLLLGTAVLLSACATKTDVVARVTPGFAPSLANPIALSQSPFPTPELLLLSGAVKAEFVRRGLEFVPSAKSEFVLGCWVEENRDPDIVVKGPTQIMPPELNRTVVRTSPNGAVQVMQPVQISQGPRIQRGLESIGIRVRLFVTRPKDTNRVETAWEGYIDAGAQLSPDEYDRLVRTLMDYFGRSYIGRVKLVE